MSESTLFKVAFQQNGKTYEVYARDVYTSKLWGFVCVANLVFETSSVVIDPVEEKLRDEFGNTEALHLPMHAVVRVEEVTKKSQLKIVDASSGERIVTPFPVPSPKQ